jgi:hypothetical protein
LDFIGIAMLIYNMLDELAYELKYPKGAQDLAGEEACVNMELMQIVKERLEYQLELRGLILNPGVAYQ